jgi:hypothetical protein
VCVERAISAINRNCPPPGLMGLNNGDHNYLQMEINISVIPIFLDAVVLFCICYKGLVLVPNALCMSKELMFLICHTRSRF